MSEHHVTVSWNKNNDNHETYSIGFEGDTKITASTNPRDQNDDYLDPEQTYVASLSSCHMLSFLAVCAKNNHIVKTYEDHAVGYLGKNAKGRIAVTKVILNPVIRFRDAAPSQEQIDKMHELTSNNCFISNSVLTEIEVHSN
ncbi:MAG: OsmC family protein [Pseudomonadales bacterium]|nr:OsmC family protein [Pseudomonadales bacterium]